MVLIYEAVFKGSTLDRIKVWGEDHMLTCLKVVWGAASAPVSSMYSSQLNSVSSSMESASTWTKSPVSHKLKERLCRQSKHKRRSLDSKCSAVKYTVTALCQCGWSCHNKAGNHLEGVCVSSMLHVLLCNATDVSSGGQNCSLCLWVTNTFEGLCVRFIFPSCLETP